jgi:hypothetical protein
MSVILRVLIFVAGLLLVLVTLRSLIRRGFTERQSLFWVLCGVVLMFISTFPQIAYLIADVFGVDYIPSIFFALAILMAMYGIFYCYKAITALQNRVLELAMQVSLLNQENRLLKGNLQHSPMDGVCGQLAAQEGKNA